MTQKSLQLERVINATPETVYRAFVNPMMMRRWLADGVQLGLPNQEAFFLTWNLGYCVVGRYKAREASERVVMSWRGDNEPATSEVEIRLSAEGEGTRVVLTHSEIGTDAAWGETFKQLQEGWETGLENLQSTLETGLDLRLMRRPMVGIFPSPLNTATAETLGVPVTKGVLINGVLPDGGAAKAGLQVNDVIVMLDGKEVYDFPTFGGVVSKHQAGDTLSMEFYRAAEKHTAELTLGFRPEPELPESPDALADDVRGLYDELVGELEALVAGHSDEVLSKAPAEGEWSVMRNIAHLVWTERFIHMYLWNVANGDDTSTWMGNGEPQTSGILAAYPTGEAMLEAYRGCKSETVAMLRSIPESVSASKGSMRIFAQSVKGNTPHDRQHFEQIKSVLEALGVITVTA